MNLFRKSILGLALGAATLSSASPALADGWRGHRHGGGDDAAIAIGAGVVGLALGAAIASSRDDDRYERDDYYYDRGYPQYREYYYYREGPRYPGRYYRHDRGWHNGWREHEWREHRGYWRGW